MQRIQTTATLRAAAIKRGAQVFRAKTQSLAAPVGGWNARDSWADMAPDDAVILSNWFPSATDVSMRGGYSRHAYGFTGQCESLLVYNSPTTSKMFAAVATALSIYDVTSGGTVGAAAVTGLTNARFQYINFATAGGNFMYAVNGSDGPQLYDGTTWTTITAVSVPAITGVTAANLIHVNVFKRRLWFVEKNTLKVWYLPIDSIGGAAQQLNFQSLAGIGGYLVAMGTWTVDSGQGPDDLAVFVTSQGQVIVYRGIDPANDVTWTLAGVWNVGAPIGLRCFIKYGGDLLLLTFDGVFELSKLLQSNTIDYSSALSDKIRTAMSDAVAAYSGNFGWEMISYPKANALHVNIPVTTGSAQVQYVMNTITKAWCDFSGWTANCWALFNQIPYFGANGFVALAWSGFADNTSDITGQGQQAFNYFGSRGQLKRFTMMRPMISSNGIPGVLVDVNVDFDTSVPTGSASLSPMPTAVWDTAIWDATMWSGDTIYKVWQGVSGIGFCGAPVLVATINGMDCRWLATDVVLEPGAVI